MRRLLQVSAGVALVGVALGCSASSGSAPASSATKRADPDVITAVEIQSQPFRNGYDVVQRLRPTWFTRTSRMGTSSSLSRAGAGLVVYMNNARLGGIGALSQLTADSIDSLEFLDAAKATATLPGIGSSAITGAIVVRMRTGP